MPDEAKTPTPAEKPKVDLKPAETGTLFHDVHANEAKALTEARAAHAKAVEAKAGVEEAAKKVADAEKAFVEKAKPSFKELGTFDKIKAKVKGNFGTELDGKEVTKFKKGMRVTGTAVGVIMVAHGLKNIVAPKRDEEGNRASGFAVPVVEAVGGAALVYASLLHGGAGRAVGATI